MKRSIYILAFTLLYCSCDNKDQSKVDLSGNVTIDIPAVEYGISEVGLDKSRGLWLFQSDSSRVSGYVVEYYTNGALARRFGVLDGKKQGLQQTYFPDGKLKFQETFNDNRLEGSVKRWSKKDGYQLMAHLTYRHGKLHGEQKQWYSTGELHKHMNINMGKEDGLQKAYRKNGALYANYEARNGRIFGLMRSNLCYELENGKVAYKQ